MFTCYDTAVKSMTDTFFQSTLILKKILMKVADALTTVSNIYISER